MMNEWVQSFPNVRRALFATCTSSCASLRMLLTGLLLKAQKKKKCGTWHRLDVDEIVSRCSTWVSPVLWAETWRQNSRGNCSLSECLVWLILLSLQRCFFGGGICGLWSAQWWAVWDREIVEVWKTAVVTCQLCPGFCLERLWTEKRM
jgi:hypothetical protein